MEGGTYFFAMRELFRRSSVNIDMQKMQRRLKFNRRAGVLSIHSPQRQTSDIVQPAHRHRAVAIDFLGCEKALSTK
jgi:hypothetical protein